MKTNISISDLESDAGRILDAIRGSSEPVFVLQGDEPPAVLISIEHYREIEKALALLGNMRDSCARTVVDSSSDPYFTFDAASYSIRVETSSAWNLFIFPAH
jgi:PHD/YefM family antitoxin component YafN of YafNO toxin-antitoxin module